MEVVKPLENKFNKGDLGPPILDNNRIKFNIMNVFKNYYIQLMGALLLITQISYGQTYNETTSDEESVISNIELSKSVLSNLGIGTGTNPRNATIEGNSVFLEQIGQYNTTSIKTRTESSEINVLQDGNRNDVDITYEANTAIADLVQNGNNNQIVDFVIDENADISLDLIQDGNNLKFVREGVNSLTKSLKFKQTEASPVLIIRSYN